MSTLNLFEAARRFTSNPLVVFTSTNKVYGGTDDAKIVCAVKKLGSESQASIRSISQKWRICVGVPRTRRRAKDAMVVGRA